MNLLIFNLDNSVINIKGFKELFLSDNESFDSLDIDETIVKATSAEDAKAQVENAISAKLCS